MSIESANASSGTAMTRTAWLLFAAMSVIWGIPYLFIKIAVVELSPVTIAGLRTLIGGLLLLPLAARAGAIRPALTRSAWPYIVLFGVIEMAIPWVLIGQAETKVASSFAGLMLAAVPIVSTVVAWALGDRHSITRIRLLGLAVGVAGVAALVGLDWLHGEISLISVLELLITALCYATAPAMVARKLTGVPSLGVAACSLTLIGVVYLPFTVHGLSGGVPSTKVVLSVLVLALVCTALAFVLFFSLLAAAGPVRTTLITFVNPAVAIVLGILVLGEPLTVGTIVGFPLVLLGCYWATRVPAAASTQQPAADEVSAAPTAPA